MFWKIVLRGSNPSGRVLAVVCARTGATIDAVKQTLVSSGGLVLERGLTRERAFSLAAELPDDSSVQISTQVDEPECVPVLMGYRPGSRGRLRTALQKLSRLPTEDVIRFLSSIPIVLKNSTDRATAESIKRILEGSGGIVEIRSPQDLAGVALKSLTRQRSHASVAVKTGSGSAQKTTEEKQRAFPGAAVVPRAESAAPPVADDSVSLQSNYQLIIPDQIVFSPPLKVPVEAPPALEETARKEMIFTEPYSIRFTVPAVLLPAVVPSGSDMGNLSFLPPDRVLSPGIVPIYLFPVGTKDKKRVQDVLCEYLGLSRERAARLVRTAPAALTGFSERIDALVAVSELSEQGIPVSLFQGSCSVREPSSAKSLFGWLNGHGRIS